MILSRKGFDSGYGGKPSIILPSGAMVSLPIPEAGSPLRYSHCVAPTGDSYLDLLGSLGIKHIKDPSARNGERVLKLINDPGVHLDPDLNNGALARETGWRPLFGQVGAAQSHLANNGVVPGDVFLFFGWFARVDVRDSGFRYGPRAEWMHAIFGWLEVDEVLAVSHDPIPDWAAQHPHVVGRASERFGSNNTLYVGVADSTVARGVPGAGTFAWNEELRLTKSGATPSVWHLPSAFHPDNTYPASMTYNRPEAWSLDGEHCTLRSARIGQEFVVPMTPAIEDWVRSLLAR